MEAPRSRFGYEVAWAVCSLLLAVGLVLFLLLPLRLLSRELTYQLLVVLYGIGGVAGCSTWLATGRPRGGPAWLLILSAELLQLCLAAIVWLAWGGHTIGALPPLLLLPWFLLLGRLVRDRHADPTNRREQEAAEPKG